MSLSLTHLKVPALDLPVKAVLRRLGYPPGMEGPDDTVRDIWDAMARALQERAAARAHLAVLSISQNNGQSVTFADADWSIDSPQVARLLGDGNQAALLLCTLGPAVDELINQLMASGMATDAFILDAMASEFVDAVADWAHYEYLPYALGCTVTPRFSPGYGDWPLNAQQRILPLMEADELGIVLSSSSLMDPRKSVSAIWGIRKENQNG